MKLFWTGTDSLMLVDYSMRTFRKKVYWWLFRRLIRIMDYFIQEHYCDSQFLAVHIEEFGTKRNIKVVPDRLKHTEPYPKEAHDGFTVLLYRPMGADKKFTSWLYGFDIMDEVKERLPHVNFLEVHGGNDMKYVYPFVDFYLRPNRHDGASRMRRECDIQNIPYYWSRTNPSVGDAVKVIEDAEKNYKI